MSPGVGAALDWAAIVCGYAAATLTLFVVLRAGSSDVGSRLGWVMLALGMIAFASRLMLRVEGVGGGTILSVMSLAGGSTLALGLVLLALDPPDWTSELDGDAV